ncbi:MAG: putative bicarbonate transporter, IctB family [Synechococcales cyanobacterium K44_A2020_017]|uniref:IctB family putative bicarbonate transporter n=1 Tax=Leptolyngbya sp. CCY15150 TaxID=2767772 RepID=UPI0019522572|nr:IctB family putative bicarbonate transporter [Leptolyngbya sp. CCY15150]MBF2089104.1 putative bicarbonate transporter, IctB family [Synechococcales cyanobacterium K32_A2020_035]MBF2095662.1 putative bicarbonate transporter, IctB family [Synechococcales cyanobacterium K44_A2020_017]
MTSVWQQVLLARPVSLEFLGRWASSSYLLRWLPLLQAWRSSSWLLQWSEAIALVLAALVYVLAPFVSTTLIGILLMAASAFWLLRVVSEPADLRRITPIHMLVGLYWAISTVATVLSPVRSAALDGWVKLTLYLLLFVWMARLLRSPQMRSILISIYLHVSLLVSVAGIRQFIFGADALATWVDVESSLAGTTRVYSYLGNPNLLASYLMPAVMLSAAAIFAWQRWLPKALASMMFVVHTACLVLTFSRGGWIGLVVGGFIFVLLLVHWYSIHLPRFWRIWSIPIVLGLSAGFVVVAVMAVEPLRDRVASMFVGREDSSNNFRINVWMSVIEMIKDRPILGIGPGNSAFNRIYPFYQQPGYTALSAYSIVLEVAAETGLIGLTCMVWLLLVTFHQGWTQLQRLRNLSHIQGFWLMGAIATMMGMLAHGVVDTVWYRPQVSTLWWGMVALVASYYVLPRAESPSGEQFPSDKDGDLGQDAFGEPGV